MQLLSLNYAFIILCVSCNGCCPRVVNFFTKKWTMTSTVHGKNIMCDSCFVWSLWIGICSAVEQEVRLSSRLFIKCLVIVLAEWVAQPFGNLAIHCTSLNLEITAWLSKSSTANFEFVLFNLNVYWRVWDSKFPIWRHYCAFISDNKRLHHPSLPPVAMDTIDKTNKEV